MTTRPTLPNLASLPIPRRRFGQAAAALGCLVGSATLGLPPEAAAAEPVDLSVVWPQWRGPTRDGKVPGTGWPEKLGEAELRLKWRTPLAEGYPGPIVSTDRVFVAETKDRKTEVVRALDRATGKEVWNAQWEGSMLVPFFAAANGSWIRATPAFDGERLYVAGMKDVLVCLEAASGKELWRVDFVKRFGTEVPAFGFASSPLVDGELVIVQAGGSVVALNRVNGETVWRALADGGGMMGSAFSSPAIAEVAGKRQLLVQTRKELAGLVPSTGEVLWTQPIEATRGMNILTPTLYQGGLVTSAHGGKTFLWKAAEEGGKVQVKPAWEQKSQGYMSSPVVVGDHLYLHLRNQRAICIDLRTGKETWSSKPYGQYWSMLVQGEKILALDERGELILFKANPEKFELLDQRKVSEAPTWGHLAVVGSEVFVRELNAIAVYEWSVPAAKDAKVK